MGMEKWISRKEEGELPEFRTHDEAKKWFIEKYGEKNFILEDIDIVNGVKMYFYQLIHDREAWEKGQKELKENGYASGMEFMSSAQPIQIRFDGSIHIVH